MERTNREIRGREKVMRGLKKIDMSILLAYQLYHNYFREHKGLGSKTLAGIASIKIEGATSGLQSTECKPTRS